MYQVEWAPAAVDQLAAAWTAADSRVRAAITAATADLDRELAADPSGVGESRPGDFRVHYVLPLGVRYRVLMTQRVVQVVNVWLVRRRS